MVMLMLMYDDLNGRLHVSKLGARTEIAGVNRKRLRRSAGLQLQQSGRLYL